MNHSRCHFTWKLIVACFAPLAAAGAQDPLDEPALPIVKFFPETETLPLPEPLNPPPSRQVLIRADS